VGAAVSAQAWSGTSMWVDRAFVPVRYAFSFSWGRSGRLPGQDAATMGFLDSLWVSVLTGLHGIGVEPVKALPVLGVLAAGLCVTVLFADAIRRLDFGRCLLPVVAFAASSPLLIAARSGTNDAWLAMWTALVLMTIRHPLDTPKGRVLPTIAVGGLALCGPFGLAASLGAVAADRRMIWSVSVAGAVQVMGGLLLGLEFPTALAVDLQIITPQRLVVLAGAMPVLLTLGVFGVGSTTFGHPATRVAGWCALVWLFRGITGSGDVAPGADRFLPAVVAFCWLSTHTMMNIRRGRAVVITALLLVVIDVARPRASVEGVARERRIALKESQAMARFLKWRFSSPQPVVLHSAGSIAYHYGGPVIDASGRTEVREMSPESILGLRPAAMVPSRNFVGPSITFTPMFEGAQATVAAAYDHHSVQHQRKWGLTQAHPVFFQYLTRKDIARLPDHISEEDGNRFPKQ